MAVYTLINKSQLNSLLSFYDLGELQGYSPIKSGTANSNYEVVTLKNNRPATYVLTILETKLSKIDLEFCLDFTNYLAKHDIPVANPVFDRHKSCFRLLVDKFVIISPFLKGNHMVIDYRSEHQLTTVHCSELGRTLAKMHILGSRFDKKRKNPYGMAWCFSVFDRLIDSIPCENKHFIQDEFDYLSKNQSVINKYQLSTGAVHADMFCDNILFYKDKLQGIIDFYNTCIDYLLYDLAIVINDLAINKAGHIVTDNYDAVINSYLAELATDSGIFNNLQLNIRQNPHVWQFMLRRAALCFWLMRLEAYYLPKDSETELSVKNVKDPTEFEIKLLLHRSQQLKIDI